MTRNGRLSHDFIRRFSSKIFVGPAAATLPGQEQRQEINRLELTLYRLENIFQRSGFEIDRSTMCVWAGDVADLVRPVYRRMVQRVLQSHVIGTDDTVLPMLAPEKCRQARMWVYRGDEDHPYNVFDFTLSRGRDGPATFLGDYRGTLLADAYGGYDGIAVEKEIVLAGCWAHARRKFVDSHDLDPTDRRRGVGANPPAVCD